MTREEAISCIKHELLATVNRKDLTGEAIGEALDMAIEALSATKPIVKNYDLISRADAIEVVCDDCPISFKEKCEWRDNGHCSTKVALEALPSADRPNASDCWGCNCPKMEREQHADRQTELLQDGTLKVNVKNGADVKRVLVWGDDGCGGLYYADDRPSGEWVSRNEVFGAVYCSECGYELRINDTDYCPACGAKMGAIK